MAVSQAERQRKVRWWKKQVDCYMTVSRVGAFELIQALQKNWGLDALALDS